MPTKVWCKVEDCWVKESSYLITADHASGEPSSTVYNLYLDLLPKQP